MDGSHEWGREVSDDCRRVVIEESCVSKSSRHGAKRLDGLCSLNQGGVVSKISAASAAVLVSVAACMLDRRRDVIDVFLWIYARLKSNS